jgi:hypothetical protein
MAGRCSRGAAAGTVPAGGVGTDAVGGPAADGLGEPACPAGDWVPHATSNKPSAAAIRLMASKRILETTVTTGLQHVRDWSGLQAKSDANDRSGLVGGPGFEPRVSRSRNLGGFVHGDRRSVYQASAHAQSSATPNALLSVAREASNRSRGTRSSSTTRWRTSPPTCAPTRFAHCRPSQPACSCSTFAST